MSLGLELVSELVYDWLRLALMGTINKSYMIAQVVIHRTSFNVVTKYDNSALSIHEMEMHQDSFSLDNFTVLAQ